MAKLKDFTGSLRCVLANILITDWSGMNSHQWQQHVTISFQNCSARESTFFVMFGRDPINKLNMLLHAARRYFHDDNGLPNLEALKNIYQVVTQQLLNSRERYVKKHHNQQ